ncbi:MAG: hypothetical protein ACREBU_08305, partial [Nitrososphaera sp.]
MEKLKCLLNEHDDESFGWLKEVSKPSLELPKQRIISIYRVFEDSLSEHDESDYGGLFPVYHAEHIKSSNRLQIMTPEQAFERDEQIFKSLLPKLLKDQNYLGKYVAICGGKIAGSSADDAK